jgi:hypothetical protein
MLFLTKKIQNMSTKEVMLYIYTTKDKIPKCMDGLTPHRIFFYDQNHQVVYKMNEDCAKAMGIKIAEEGFKSNYSPLLSFDCNRNPGEY